MKGLFIDADAELAAIFRRVGRPGDPQLDMHSQREVAPEDMPAVLAGYDFLVNDHLWLPTDRMAACDKLKHIIFLGTGARSYMNPHELAEQGITVHIIKGYGDTAVAEHAIALMWAAAREIALNDRAMRAGGWPSLTGMQLTGKTIGLLGYGGIAAEVARIARGSGMKVIAWNRTPRSAEGVTFVDLDTLLAQSDVLSVHLLLHDETFGFLGAERLAKMKPGAILVNTARGAIIDEAAVADALRSGHLRHAAMDVFVEEPLPAGHPFAGLDNTTLTPHAAFRTPEATDNMFRIALDIACRLAAGA
jgi:D-3-phosphoglycerate dehydrogenase